MAHSVFGYRFDASFEYENGFYLTAGLPRITKFVSHYELYKKIVGLPGHVVETSAEYVREHPELKIALLHIDTDIYEPARAAMEAFYPCIVRNGLLVLDDYGTLPDETSAVDEYFAGRNVEIHKLPVSHNISAYIVKSQISIWRRSMLLFSAPTVCNIEITENIE